MQSQINAPTAAGTATKAAGQALSSAGCLFGVIAKPPWLVV
jgi:hypothetical protein